MRKCLWKIVNSKVYILLKRGVFMEDFLFGHQGSPTHNEEDYERFLAENMYWDKINNPKRTRNISESMLRKYKEFVKKTIEQELFPQAVFLHVSEKRSLFREILNYTKLNGERRGTKIPLDDCSDSQIGKAFRNTYNTALRAISS